jgi:hypothetical protein
MCLSERHAKEHAGGFEPTYRTKPMPPNKFIFKYNFATLVRATDINDLTEQTTITNEEANS